MNVRGQFYMIDAFFAAVILFVGVGALMLNTAEAPEQHPAQLLSSDMVRVLLDVPLANLTNAYLVSNENIIDFQYTAAQQAFLWLIDAQSGCRSLGHAAACTGNATALIYSLTYSLAPEQFGFNVTIMDAVSPPVNLPTPVNLTTRMIARSPELFISERQLFYARDSTGTVRGPEVMIVEVWQ